MGGDFDRLPRPGIARRARCPITHSERAKTRELNLSTPGKLGGDGLTKRVHGGLRLLLAQPGLGHALDKVLFLHAGYPFLVLKMQSHSLESLVT